MDRGDKEFKYHMPCQVNNVLACLFGLCVNETTGVRYKSNACVS